MATFRSHTQAVAAIGVILWLSLNGGVKAVEFAGGTGEPNDPYQIAAAEQLIAIGSDPNLLDKHFVLVADIDLDPNLPGGRVFSEAVIAKVTGYGQCGTILGPLFEGTFNGQQHTVQNLTLRVSDKRGFLGLFGRLGTRARVLGLRLADVSIRAENDVGDVGGLAGSNGGAVLDCRVDGLFSAGRRLNCFGGLVGTNNGIVADSMASIRVTVASAGAKGEGGSENIGGLVGMNRGAVTCCAANSKITTAFGCASVGGLAGQNAEGVICNCSAAGTLPSGWACNPSGGLAGYNNLGSVINCFSTCLVDVDDSVANLIGSGWVGVSGCYCLDPEDDGERDAELDASLTDSQMRRQESFVGWDFLGQRHDGTSEIWMMPPEGGYPVLSILHGYQPAPLCGSGVLDDPFLIETLDQLGTAVYRPEACFRLVADLDASGIAWSSAVIPGLMGSLDGAGHRILRLSVDSSGHAGLVGLVFAGARVTDLGVEEAAIVGPASSRYIGVVAAVNRGLVHACNATGSVAGAEAVGGLVGKNFATISNSWTDCSISPSAAGLQLGGLVGSHWAGLITACYALGPVVGKADSVGGLVGSGGMVNSGIGGQIADSYARGSVDGKDGVGGLVGFMHAGGVTRCFSVGGVHGEACVGGLVGKTTSYGEAVDCLWDVQASGIPASAKGLGFSTGWLMSGQAFAFNGWADDPNWVLDAGRDYPHLAWEGTPGRPIPQPAVDWSSGSGTAEDPFRIRSSEQLWLIAHARVLWDKHFVLDADLDLGDMLFEPIGGAWPVFTGSFDGAGHTLRNLTIHRDNDGVACLGLFGIVGSPGQIRDLAVEDASVVLASKVSEVGILVGYASGAISGCRVTGRIHCGDYSERVGGLIGEGNGAAVRDCHADVAIVAGKGSRSIGGLAGSRLGSRPTEDCSAAGSIEVLEEGLCLGGLVGWNSAPITRCCARGSVTAGGDSGLMGGLIGENNNGSYSASVLDCYATGRVQGRDWLGGLIGSIYFYGRPNKVERCWAAGQVVGRMCFGGLIGSPGDLAMKDCYRLDPAGGGGLSNQIGTALTSEQMKQKASFPGWDFETVWSICEGRDYPRLRWEQVECE
ncbi:MAG: hypothetical protein ABFE01_29565 [Phycisphaerales bacterium]